MNHTSSKSASGVLWKSVLILMPVALFIGLAWKFRERSMPQTVVFANGTVARFLGVEMGGQTFTTEKPWHRTARRILPAKMHGWIPQAASGSCGFGSNSMTVYLELTGAASATGQTQPWAWHVAGDVSGEMFEVQGGSCSFGSSGAQIVGLSLRALPRRDKMFRFHFLDTERRILGTFTVPNPFHGPFPKWSPEPWPQTTSNGPVALTLESLTFAGSPRSPHVVPTWRVVSADPLWTNARPRYISFADATGNEGSLLSTNEPAWKLRTVVHRQRPEEFTAAEKLVLTNLTMPPDGGFLALDQATEIAGVKLLVHGLGGAGQLVFTNGTNRVMLPPTSQGSGWSSSSGSGTTVERFGQARPFFFIEVIDAERDDDIRFRLTDANGREIPLEESGYRSRHGSDARVHMPTFDRAATGSPVTLEILVSRPLLFEFLVDPRTIRPQSGN